MDKIKMRCCDCGAEWTEIYPVGLEDSTESYSDPDDPKPCDCQSQFQAVVLARLEEGSF